MNPEKDEESQLLEHIPTNYDSDTPHQKYWPPTFNRLGTTYSPLLKGPNSSAGEERMFERVISDGKRATIEKPKKTVCGPYRLRLFLRLISNFCAIKVFTSIPASLYITSQFP